MKATATHAPTLVTAHAKGRRLRAAAVAARVKAGLPVDEFDALRELLDLTVERLAGKIGVSTARRRSITPTPRPGRARSNSSSGAWNTASTPDADALACREAPARGHGL